MNERKTLSKSKSLWNKGYTEWGYFVVKTIHCVDYEIQKGINHVLYTYFYHLLIFQIVPWL